MITGSRAGPPTEPPFPLHAEFFQDPRGSRVLDIADGPDAVDGRLGERPIHQRPRRLGGVAPAPAGPSQDVPELGPVVAEPEAHHPDGLLHVLLLDHPLRLGPRLDGHDRALQERQRRGEARMRPPGQVARDLGIGRVAGKDRLCVGEARDAKLQASGGDQCWDHRPSSAGARARGLSDRTDRGDQRTGLLDQASGGGHGKTGVPITAWLPMDQTGSDSRVRKPPE